MAGNPPPAVRAELEKQKLPAERVDYLVPHKVHAGDRPSTIVALTQIDPASLGRLVALYEHKVFVQSVVWGINAFDQWGVELGKKLAEQLAPAVRDPSGNPPASPVVSPQPATFPAGPTASTPPSRSSCRPTPTPSTAARSRRVAPPG